MYTGGVSSLAEQIASQLQSPEDPKPPPEKRDLVSTPFSKIEGTWQHELKSSLARECRCLAYQQHNDMSLLSSH